MQLRKWQEQVAVAYLRGTHESQAKEVHDVAREFITDRFNRLSGVTFTWVEEAEPYATVEDLRKDVRKGVLRVAKTQPEDVTNSLFDEQTNDLFRAWHDVTHHVKYELAFTPDDEFHAWQLVDRSLHRWGMRNGVDYAVERQVSRMLFCEMAGQPFAATWLGGYGGTRDGLSFTQKLVTLR